MNVGAATASIKELLEELRLPPNFSNIHWYGQVAEALVGCRSKLDRPLLVGIAGSQGSGKSTMAVFLRALLQQRGLPTANLSLDDFYLPRSERLRRARAIHPLLITRGVPGTHDVECCVGVIEQLVTAVDGAVTRIPRFDKAHDDRLPPESWECFSGRAEVVLLEGWCVGAAPESDAALETPLNDLEVREDPTGSWRSFVNCELRTHYRFMFDRLDLLVFLAAPSFECVFKWRKLQEDKLRTASRTEAAAKGVMDEAALTRFIMHYERITRNMLREMPQRADVVLRLDEDQEIVDLRQAPRAASAPSTR